MTDVFALFGTALLFGGMVLYSFGFAPFLFRELPPEAAGKLLRRAFPWYYLGVTILAAVSIVFLVGARPGAAMTMGFIAVSALAARQLLMPAINAARDAGRERQFNILHGSSVALNMIQLLALAVILYGFAH